MNYESISTSRTRPALNTNKPAPLQDLPVHNVMMIAVNARSVDFACGLHSPRVFAPRSQFVKCIHVSITPLALSSPHDNSKKTSPLNSNLLVTPSPNTPRATEMTGTRSRPAERCHQSQRPRRMEAVRRQRPPAHDAQPPHRTPARQNRTRHWRRMAAG